MMANSTKIDRKRMDELACLLKSLGMSVETDIDIDTLLEAHLNGISGYAFIVYHDGKLMNGGLPEIDEVYKIPRFSCNIRMCKNIFSPYVDIDALLHEVETVGANMVETFRKLMKDIRIMKIKEL